MLMHLDLSCCVARCCASRMEDAVRDAERGSRTPSRESCIGCQDQKGRQDLEGHGPPPATTHLETGEERRPYKARARDAVSPPMVEAEGPSAHPTRPADRIPLVALLLGLNSLSRNRR